MKNNFKKNFKKLLKLPNVKQTPIQKMVGNGNVECGVCERRCVIPLNKRGVCNTKININSKLYSLVYGDISSLQSRPIEIKPFFHFYPGSRALTFSTWSCNFKCPWCQNYTLSKKKPNPLKANYISPEDIVSLAINERDNGICVSFNEPTMLFEYSLDVFKLAKEKGLYNCYVSNGYMTEKAIEMLAESGIDAIKIDVKGDREAYIKYPKDINNEVIWRNAKYAKELGLHVEMVFLVIPGVNNSPNVIEEIINKHLKTLGSQVPLHFTRYFPAYKFINSSTSIRTLEWAYNKAKEKGILFPYIGNVIGHDYENTYCPNCGEVLVKRFGFQIISYGITKDKKCPSCGEKIPIIGSPPKKLTQLIWKQT